MIDRDLQKKLSYEDFLPILRDIHKCIRRLDSLDVRFVVGDRVVDVFENHFIRLVLDLYDNLTPIE